MIAVNSGMIGPDAASEFLVSMESAVVVASAASVEVLVVTGGAECITTMVLQCWNGKRGIVIVNFMTIEVLGKIEFLHE